MTAFGLCRDRAIIAAFGSVSMTLFITLGVAFRNAPAPGPETSALGGLQIVEGEGVAFDVRSGGVDRIEVEAEALKIQPRAIGGFVLRPWKRIHLSGVRVRRTEKGEFREEITADRGLLDVLTKELSLRGGTAVRFPDGRTTSCKEARIRLDGGGIGVLR